jgi:hypothetical protein
MFWNMSRYAKAAEVLCAYSAIRSYTALAV